MKDISRSYLVRVLIPVFVLILSGIVYAQEWANTYGGGSNDYASSIQQTTDGGYIVAGYTYSFGAGLADIWVLKLDASGNVTWQKTYGGGSYDEAISIQQTTDGGYIVAGYTRSFGAGNGDFWVLKLDGSGEILGCAPMGTSNATVTTTTISGVDTGGSANTSTATGANTTITPADTTAQTLQQCVAYTLTVSKQGTGSGTVTSNPAGISCGADCSEAYASATVVTLTATPDTGSTFTAWSGDPDCSDGTVTMNASKTCIANFTLNQYNITATANPSAGGSVTCSPNPVNHGSTSTCSITTNPGYTL